MLYWSGICNSVESEIKLFDKNVKNEKCFEIGENLVKQKNYYDELYIQVLFLERMDVLTVSGGDIMTPEGDYDDDDGWNE